MSQFNSSGGDVIAQCVINPDAAAPAFISQFGFKGTVQFVAGGAFNVSLNPELNYAAPDQRQVIASLQTPGGTAQAFQCVTQLNADPQTVSVVIFDAAGTAITAPPAGSRVQLTVLRAALPQG